jgi:hypothetical protein
MYRCDRRRTTAPLDVTASRTVIVTPHDAHLGCSRTSTSAVGEYLIDQVERRLESVGDGRRRGKGPGAGNSRSFLSVLEPGASAQTSGPFAFAILQDPQLLSARVRSSYASIRFSEDTGSYGPNELGGLGGFANLVLHSLELQNATATEG